MVNTIYGEMDESSLKKETGVFEDENELTTWVAYYLGDELVHRSAHVHIKKGDAAGILAQAFS
jgi:hypothetical protein